MIETATNPHISCLNTYRIPCACPAKRHLKIKKCSKPRHFHALTSNSASCHNGLHFLDISTSKGGPILACFVHFDLEMCFAPQRRSTPDGSAPAALASLLFDRPGPQIIGKAQHFAYLLAHLDLVSFDYFSSLILSLLCSFL